MVSHANDVNKRIVKKKWAEIVFRGHLRVYLIFPKFNLNLFMYLIPLRYIFVLEDIYFIYMLVFLSVVYYPVYSRVPRRALIGRLFSTRAPF